MMIINLRGSSLFCMLQLKPIYHNARFTFSDTFFLSNAAKNNRDERGLRPHLIDTLNTQDTTKPLLFSLGLSSAHTAQALVYELLPQKQ